MHLAQDGREAVAEPAEHRGAPLHQPRQLVRRREHPPVPRRHRGACVLIRDAHPVIHVAGDDHRGRRPRLCPAPDMLEVLVATPHAAHQPRLRCEVRAAQREGGPVHGGVHRDRALVRREGEDGGGDAAAPHAARPVGEVIYGGDGAGEAGGACGACGAPRGAQNGDRSNFELNLQGGGCPPPLQALSPAIPASKFTSSGCPPPPTGRPPPPTHLAGAAGAGHKKNYPFGGGRRIRTTSQHPPAPPAPPPAPPAPPRHAGGGGRYDVVRILRPPPKG
eukprot:gene4466-biopygen17443